MSVLLPRDEGALADITPAPVDLWGFMRPIKQGCFVNFTVVLFTEHKEEESFLRTKVVQIASRPGDLC